MARLQPPPTGARSPIPPFPKPRSDFDYELSVELRALRGHKKRRRIPGRSRDRLLLATLNVVNFGVHERREKDHRLIAEVPRLVRPRRSSRGR